MGRTVHQWPEDEVLLAALGAAGGPHLYARQIGVAPSTLYSYLRRCGLEQRAREVIQARPVGELVQEALTASRSIRTGEQKPVTEVTGDTAKIISAPAPDLGDVDALLRERNLDPADWTVERAKLNEWDAMTSDKATGDNRVIKMRQLTVHLKRRTPVEWVFPAVDVEPRDYRPRAPRAGAAQTVVCLPDQHAPYHDEQVHDHLMGMLAYIQPQKVVNLGDLGDYATISKHRDNPAWSAGPKESIQGSYQILSDQRATLPAAEIVLLKGNHDWRLETELLARAERMFGIAPADVPGQDTVPAYSLRHLLHLDALGVELVEPELAGDNYQHAEHWLSPSLVCVHGDKTQQRAALATARKVGASTITGHTHKLCVMKQTVWLPGRGRVELTGAEAGTLRSITKSAGFVNRPDWQNGCVVATLHPDGHHDIELVGWDGSSLLWRGQRF